MSDSEDDEDFCLAPRSMSKKKPTEPPSKSETVTKATSSAQSSTKAEGISNDSSSQSENQRLSGPAGQELENEEVAKGKKEPEGIPSSVASNTSVEDITESLHAMKLRHKQELANLNATFQRGGSKSKKKKKKKDGNKEQYRVQLALLQSKHEDELKQNNAATTANQPESSGQKTESQSKGGKKKSRSQRRKVSE